MHGNRIVPTIVVLCAAVSMLASCGGGEDSHQLNGLALAEVDVALWQLQNKEREDLAALTSAIAAGANSAQIAQLQAVVLADEKNEVALFRVGPTGSFVIASPGVIGASADDLSSIGSIINANNAAAAASTTGVLAASADEVSNAIANLFGAYGQEYQQLSEQAADFHNQFVQLINSGSGSYSSP